MATNLAYKPDYDITNAVLPSERLTFQASENSHPWVMTVKPEPLMFEFDTGLRADIRLTLPVSKSSIFPQHIFDLVERIKALEDLPLNWDSYGALPIDDRAVRATMNLIIEAEKTCCSPDRVVPLASGGLGLRWRSADVELEVDVDTDKSCSAILETGEDEFDLPRGSSLSRAMDLVARYRRLR